MNRDSIAKVFSLILLSMLDIKITPMHILPREPLSKISMILAYKPIFEKGLLNEAVGLVSKN